ncbi:HNH endonuclease signature motif containing protein [Arthrobacter silvisoli]|uniref:HNH endonuclease signature motif containing protein n=1 Tax=Arthrobacter silvisoli TaxID=2291022 RepID=UPI000E21796E|nr:HNH endonuclease signature motif containing protein [Arthrobacter silvisoli]
MENSTALAQAPGKQVLPVDALADVVSSLESLERVQSRLHAVREGLLVMASQLAEAMEDDGGVSGSGWRPPARELAQRSVAAEIAAATRMSDRTVQRQMGQAVELADRFPVTFDALSAGRISLAHARVIQDAGTVLEDAASRARYEEAVLECAFRQAPGRVRRLAVREAEKVQSGPLADRHERARKDRRVWVNPLPDGMAELGAVLPAVVAYGIHDRLTRMAQAHADAAKEHDYATENGAGAQAGRGAGASRTMDQLRADLLADVLLRGAPTGHDTREGILSAITARVDITVPAHTLMGSEGHGAASGPGTDEPGADGTAERGSASGFRGAAELDGRHPIDPDTARILAGAAPGWNRVFTDPVNGTVLAVDRYRPGEDLRRLLRARDSRCRFPGCGIKARDLDLDHTHDAALGGATEAANLAALCRRHHTLKHHSGWTTRQSGNGNLEWTSPTGRSYTDRPPTPATSTAGDIRPRPGDPPAKAKPPPF